MLRLFLPGPFGQKARRNSSSIAAKVRVLAAAQVKSRSWEIPKRAKLSVSLAFFSRDHSAPAVHNLVKFYLDELRGIAFADDRQISHLTAEFSRVRGQRSSGESGAKSDVYITVERLTDYKRRFDLYFELLSYRDVEQDFESEHNCAEPDYYESDYRSFLASLPDDVRQQWKKMERDAAQKNLLSHSKLDKLDRPGVHRHVRRLLPALEQLRKSSPLIIDLGTLPQKSGESAAYKDGIRRQIQQFKNRRKIFNRISVPIDVDIRISSHTLQPQKDLDNVARDVIPVVMSELVDEPHLLNGYRIYVSDLMDQPGMGNRLALKFLPMWAIREFHDKISETLSRGEDWLKDRM